MDTPEKIRLKKSTGKLHVETPGQASYLTYLRALVADLARQVGFPDDEVAKIEMAVGEACENVVEHAYDTGKQWRLHQPDPEIRMDIRTENGRLIIEIKDHGQRFDFANYRPEELDVLLKEARPGGFGIAIMRKFMDEVHYSSNDRDGNTLRLVKHLQKP